VTEGIDVDIPAAWHPDPLGRYEYRYWDGQRWTEHVANQGIAGVDATGLEPPAAAQQTGGWASTGGEQPAGGQPASGWGQDTTPQAQEAQQPAVAPMSEPAAEPGAGTGATGGHAPTADDPDHWQRPWTAEATAQTGVAAGIGAVGVDEPAADTTAASAERSAPVAGTDEDPTHWQQPWTGEPAAATTPAAAPEHEAEFGPGVHAEPAAATEPAATTAPVDEPDPVGQAQSTTGSAPAEDALPHWQQPWETSEPEEVGHDTPSAGAPPSEAEPESEPDRGTDPWAATQDEAATDEAGTDLGSGSEDTGLASAPATFHDGSEEDEGTGTEGAGAPTEPAHETSAEPAHETSAEHAHDTPTETPQEPAADERPHWQQPWTSSTPSS